MNATSAHALRDRLDALRAARGLPATQPRSALADLPPTIVQTLSPTLAERLARLRPWTRGDQHVLMADSDVATYLGGQCIAPGVVRIRRTLPLPHRHGRATLRPDPAPDDATPVFIDTETNGLAGGTGTIAFVIGMAVVDAAGCTITQWLLSAFRGECAMLADFAATLPPQATLRTYNGAAFDLPLLHTRLRLHALADPLQAIDHIDLLHWAKRARPPEWPNARLQTIEQRGLGFERIDDLPGSAVPAAWQAWLRAGNAAPLAKVLEHNRDDLISLAVLQQLAAAHPEPQIKRRHRQQARLFETPSPWPTSTPIARVPPFVRAPFARRVRNAPEATAPNPLAAASTPLAVMPSRLAAVL